MPSTKETSALLMPGVRPKTVLRPSVVKRMRTHIMEIASSPDDPAAVLLCQHIENAAAYQAALDDADSSTEEARFASMFDRAHRTIHSLYKALSAPASGGGTTPEPAASPLAGLIETE